MELKEIFAQMSAGKVAAHSELGTRDEARQTRNFNSRIAKMKTVTGIKAHALVFKDVVLPFNPFTGEPDQVYNRKTPFRPILLVNQTLSGIKAACAENAELKAKWEEILHTTDIDWNAAPTMQDYYTFKHLGFIKPRIMSYYTVKVSLNGIGGFPTFAQKYLVDPAELSANGTYEVDNPPMHHLGAVFFNGLLKPEADAAVKAAEKAALSKEAISAARANVYAKAPIGFVSPTNLIPFIFVPFNESPRPFKADQFSEFERYLRYYGYQQNKWGSALEEAMKEDQYDENMDFFDFTVRTPSSDAVKGDGTVYTDDDAFEIFGAMTITSTDARNGIWSGKTTIDGNLVDNKELYQFLFDAANEYFKNSQEQSAIEGGETFESLMVASSRFNPMSSVIDRLLPALNQAFLTQGYANSKYLNDNYKKANAVFFTAMNPDNAMALADYDDDEIEAAQESQKASVASLITEATGDSNEDLVIDELQLSDD